MAGSDAGESAGSSAGPWSEIATPGPVWSVAFGPDDSRLLAGGIADGTIRLWSPTTGSELGRPLTGHTGSVLAIAFGLLDGHPRLASAGIDGTVRLWDPQAGTSVAGPLLGHTGGVRAVAISQVPGFSLVASAGADGTIRVWDPRSSDPLRTTIAAHTGSALSVAISELEGAPVLASAGDDGTVKLWDLRTGEALGEPLIGHAGGVRAVRFGRVAGRDLLASASDDGTVRVWDPVTGSAVLEPLAGHTGLVRSVAFVELEDHEFLASAGIDGSVRLWDPQTGLAHPEPIVSPIGDLRSVAFEERDGEVMIAIGGGAGAAVARVTDVLDQRWMATREVDRTAIVSVDAVDAADALGRVILARHLHGVIGQLTSSQRPGLSSLVVSIDGRWGSGKTTLARLVAEEMRQHELGHGVHEPGGPSYSPEAADSADLPSDPVVITFDAWRESAVAPQWWSIAAALNRGVRRERGIVARLGMTITGAARRIFQSPGTMAAVATVVIVVLGFMALRGSAPTQLNQTLSVLQVFVSTATVVFATAALLVRSLFWASPALGRLHLRADDNPLGEVARMVTTIRRWSPRTRSNPLVESMAVACVIILATLAVRTITAHPETAIKAGVELRWIIDEPLATTFALIVAFLVGFAAPVDPPSPDRRRPPGHQWLRDRWQPIGAWLHRQSGRRLSRAVTAVVLGTLAGIAVASPLPTSAAGRWVLLGGVLVAVVLLLVGYGRYLRSAERGGRRPVIFILDELDRCATKTVVSYLETVHTLLRHGDSEGAPGRSSWRSPAALIVLVPADGRWVRTAFTSEYDAYGQLGSSVRSLGGDFLQKLFDHTVLIPELTAQHVELMLARVGLRVPSRPAPSRPRAATSATDPAALDGDIAPGDGESGAADQSESAEVQAAVQQLAREQERAAEQALEAASPSKVEHREAHLLAYYAAILPSNPRLIRRVTNTWGMLEALKLHLGHDQPDDTMVRAAIVFVAFPTLVDRLLDEPLAPTPYAPDSGRSEPQASDADWLRADVLAVLTRDDGTRVAPAAIARCFGKVYARSRHPQPS